MQLFFKSAFLIAIAKSLVNQEEPDVKTKCNLCWAKVTIPGVRSIYIGSYYHPHEGDKESLDELWSSLKLIPKNSIIWLLGDFNLPDIDWTDESLKPTCKHKELYEDFLENMVTYNLQNVVKIPTRKLNILDLFLTNLPSAICTVKTLPSLATSDHDIVFHEIQINKGRKLQPERKIPLYKRANWSQLKQDIDKFRMEF